MHIKSVLRILKVFLQEGCPAFTEQHKHPNYTTSNYWHKIAALYTMAATNSTEHPVHTSRTSHKATQTLSCYITLKSNSN